MQSFAKQQQLFDRIDVSNISDENYVGLKKIIENAKPILKEGNGRLVTILLNWVAGTEYHTFFENMKYLANAYNPPKGNIKKLLMEVFKLEKNINPLTLMEKM